ncbi:MAG: hypothetical protein R3185_06465, partial [Candidatus Thermoplasmatota archaeon]|nr:hypothetical protein [Candidatus Thermoplasmatota archaeon]
RPGTYREEVTVGKNITLVAPDGATLNGSASIELIEGIVIPGDERAAQGAGQVSHGSTPHPQAWFGSL